MPDDAGASRSRPGLKGLGAFATRAELSTEALALTGFAVALLFAWFCYQPAMSGSFQLDDAFNLGGLAGVEDGPSALEFVFSGKSGPTGRPLALASFALQADSFASGAEAFIAVNVFIHLLNAVLLALCLYQLSLARKTERADAVLAAVLTAALWVLLPLLATASLVVVQRMATMSAACMLLGLNAYLAARSKLTDRPGPALSGMSLSLVIATAAASLCKESGVLLPVLVLVLEATILPSPTGIASRRWRSWQAIFLVLPLILVTGYLAHRSAYPDALVLSRDFNAWERLMTETRLLWVYLAKALVGLPGQLGIYQDPPVVSRSLFAPLTLLASATWLALLSLSVAWRRCFPWFALAVLWYLAGHLVESTVVPLELYFEHRNYVPIIGPLFALVSVLVPEGARAARTARVLLPVLCLVNAWFLYGFASLSGDPSSAARYWAAVYAGSQRAVARKAAYQLREEGPINAIATIDTFVNNYPQHAYMRIAELNLLCKTLPGYDHAALVTRTQKELAKADFTYTAAVMLYELFGTASQTKCNGLDIETVTLLATELRNNVKYRDEPLYNQSYQKMLAAVARRQGDYDTVIGHLRQAIEYQPASDLNRMMVEALLENDGFDAALQFLDEAQSLAPANPVKAVLWRSDLASLRAQVTQRREQAKLSTRTVTAEGMAVHE